MRNRWLSRLVSMASCVAIAVNVAFEINARVAGTIAQDARFVNTSLWIETLRKFVTIKGCLVDTAQGAELEARAKAIDGVKLVWQEAVVTRKRVR